LNKTKKITKKISKNFFVTTGTKLIPFDTNKQKQIIEDFEKSMLLAYELFENDAFRKRTSFDEARKPLNKSIFEVISVAFSKINPEILNYLTDNKEDFKREFVLFQKDNKKFWNAITTGTATKESTFNRNREFNEFLNNFINAVKNKTK
jgi:hypothetical protein